MHDECYDDLGMDRIALDGILVIMGILRWFTDPPHCALKLGIIFILVLALAVKLTET